MCRVAVQGDSPRFPALPCTRPTRKLLLFPSPEPSPPPPGEIQGSGCVGRQQLTLKLLARQEHGCGQQHGQSLPHSPALTRGTQPQGSPDLSRGSRTQGGGSEDEHVFSAMASHHSQRERSSAASLLLPWKDGGSSSQAQESPWLQGRRAEVQPSPPPHTTQQPASPRAGPGQAPAVPPSPPARR